MFKTPSFYVLMVSALLITGCAVEAPMIPQPLDLPKKVAVYSALHQEDEQTREQATRIGVTPKPPAPERLQAGKSAATQAPAAKPEEADIVLSFEQIPLPSFIQAVYAVILKKNVNLEASVANRKDLVTLRTGERQTPAQVEIAARLLLKSYGIAVVDFGDLTRFVPDNANLGYLPEIRRGRALPETPLPLRPVFQLVELQAVRNSDVASWIRAMFGENKVKVQEDPSRNAILLNGNGDDVMAALEAISVLDQPLMKGRQSIRITPQFWSADELAKRLGEILQTEGYSTASRADPGLTQPITLLPVAGANAVFVFAGNEKILDHVVAWAKELDKPNEKGAGRNIFSYQVKFTDADTLAKTLQQLLSGAPLPGAAPVAGAAAASRPAQVVVDKGSNTLIFTGQSEDYGGIRNLLQNLDKPARQALIEVTVAEVSLSNDSQLGIEWLVKEANLTKGQSYTGGTLGGLSIGSSGFNFRLLDNVGDTRLVLNALASSNRATILSSPRVVARNGETATIQVGQEVPIISSQQVATTGTALTTNTTTVPQSIQYKNTGVILNVKPVIHSGDRVDIDVSQEVSAAQATTTGVSTSPTFSARKVQTKLSLRNGATVLLGGLMSSNKSEGNAGIPLLKDIPVVGQLFRNNTGKSDRTELIVLITPYIIEDDNDAQAVTEAFRKRLGPWAQKPLPDPVANEREPK